MSEERTKKKVIGLMSKSLGEFIERSSGFLSYQEAMLIVIDGVFGELPISDDIKANIRSNIEEELEFRR